ncbi:hypothetical protein DUI87_04767 [Hirundo rustica rustica]|uniref:Rho-related GTP-binding protein RhoE n=1 Tax=Hirundo rustica rustica TaxID=333673 RepID=A0A3M0L761_HIRRU|nr:hypothetical protein DUI87_04767 [Hirundo rustica rustica]
MKERRASQKLSSKAVMDPNQNVKCKIVVVGDSQCGKTALLHVFAKDCFPESYVPTVFENYTASFEIDTQRIELSLWDTSGSPYYDNVRPLSYPDSDAVLICFDISRPETLDSWKGEIQEFCPNTKMLLVGCKSDLRTDVSTLVELSNHRQTPVSYDQVEELPAAGFQPSSWLADPRLSQQEQIRSSFLPGISFQEGFSQWKGEIQEFCPNTKMLLVGCKSDLRTDVSTLVELSNHRQTPVSYDQGANMAKQIGAATYIECSALQSENSVRDIFTRRHPGVCEQNKQKCTFQIPADPHGYALGREDLDVHTDIDMDVDVDVHMDIHVDMDVDIHMDIHMDIHVDIHMDVHVDIYVDIDMDIHLDSHMDVGMDIYMNVHMDVYMDIHVDIHVDVHMDIYMDIHVDIYMDVHMDIHMDVYVYKWVRKSPSGF